MKPTRSAAFTLIELLIVVTIIVVLIAMLMPGLDRAIYQAELAACGARLKAHGATAVLYAMDHQRRYLYRPGVMDAITAGSSGWANGNPAYRPDYLAVTGPNAPHHDDRPALRPYMPVNKLMACPFVEEVDFDRAEQYTTGTDNVLLYTSYAYWYGWRFAGGAQEESGMFKVGDRFTYRDASFNVLACDTDIIDSAAPWVNGAHPETRDPILYLSTQRGRGLNPFVASYATYSFWGTWNTDVRRGPVDRNFVFDDGSVRRIDNLALDANEWDDMEIDDKRVEPVPAYTPETDTAAIVYHTWLPRR